MAWDGSQCQKVDAWPAAAPPMGKGQMWAAPGHRCIPRLYASSSISSPKGPDSERLYEEKNHAGQGHSRDTLQQIPPIESNSVNCGAAVRQSTLPGRKLGGSAPRPCARTAALACIACKAVTKKTLFLAPKNDP